MFNLKRSLLGLILLLSLGSTLEVIAQSSTMSNVFISENSFISIFGEHSFIKGGNGISPGMISTAKTSSNGVVIFAEGSSWKGASDAQFIDGYVQVYHNAPFVFPVGADGKYRPVAISGAALTSVAYFDRNPAKVTKQAAKKQRTKSASNFLHIEEMSDSEYWVVKGEKATKLTFSWGVDSNIDKLTDGDLSKLSIVGWKNGQWEIIPSAYDLQVPDYSSHNATDGKHLSNAISGAITTNEGVTPSDYEYFSLAGLNATAFAEAMDFSMYPNPRLTKMPLNVRYQLPDMEGGTLRILSVNGALLAERKLANNQGIITLSDVTNAAGAYNVSITDSKGKSLSKKLIVVAK